MVGGDAAAQYDEIRPEQRVSALDDVAELRHVTGPVELALHARAAGGAGLGLHAVEFQVPEFGVRYQLAVDEQGAADSRAQAQHQDRAHDVAGRAEVHLGESGGIGVIDGDDLSLEAQGGGLGQRLADPGLRDVGGGVHRAGHDYTGKGDGVHHFADRGHRGRGDRTAFADQGAPVQVNDGRLDRRASDIYTNCLSVHSALTRSRCGATPGDGNTSWESLPPRARAYDTGTSG